MTLCLLYQVVLSEWKVPECYIVKVSNGRRSQMADGHLGSNVQHGIVDFKVCDWPTETGFNWPTGF